MSTENKREKHDSLTEVRNGVKLKGGKKKTREESDKKTPCSGGLKLETQSEPLEPKNGHSESDQGVR